MSAPLLNIRKYISRCGHFRNKLLVALCNIAIHSTRLQLLNYLMLTHDIYIYIGWLDLTTDAAQSLDYGKMEKQDHIIQVRLKPLPRSSFVFKILYISASECQDIETRWLWW